MKNVSADLAGDLIEGASGIAEFLWGRHAEAPARLPTGGILGDLPVFRLGQIFYARKSVLLAHIEAQERAALASGKAA